MDQSQVIGLSTRDKVGFVVLLNTFTCPSSTYQSKTVSLSGFAAHSSTDGDLWLLFGTDSGFEGITIYYVDRISVTLVPQ